MDQGGRVTRKTQRGAALHPFIPNLLPSLVTVRFLVSRSRLLCAMVMALAVGLGQGTRAKMKPHIRSKGPVFSSRLRGPHAAGRVLESIKNITSELESL